MGIEFLNVLFMAGSIPSVLPSLNSNSTVFFSSRIVSCYKFSGSVLILVVY